MTGSARYYVRALPLFHRSSTFEEEATAAARASTPELIGTNRLKPPRTARGKHMTILLTRHLRPIALAVGSVGVLHYTSAAGQAFDGQWSVNVVADDANCPTQTIPVEVSGGNISFSAPGASVTGQIGTSGSVEFSISLNEQTVQISGTVSGREASGSWESAPAGCSGTWTAEIAD